MKKFSSLNEDVEYEGKWESNALNPNSEEYNFIKEFFLEMIDEGLEVDIYKYTNGKMIQYSITMRKRNVEGDRKNKEWYKQHVIEYGKMFYDTCLSFESQSDGKITELNVYGDRGSTLSYIVEIDFNSPII